MADERRPRRGRLKVFLGYASRVGKSFRMLDEGRRRKERGQDVVIGAIQSRITPDVETLLPRFEVIPTIRSQHDGRTYESMDLPRLIARHPRICLIDELAYDNPPGNPHPQRWQDVAVLLDNGIGVLTALNLQHIEEELDSVERITGKRAVQTVPGKFIKEADEIVIVDALPEDVADRTGGMPPDVNRFTRLRERALLLAADVVEKQLHSYLDAHHLPQTWGLHERILVCLTARSNAPEMLAAGKRNAERFHGQLLVCSVEQPNLNAVDRERLKGNLEMARAAGAEVHVLPGRDFAGAILEFARLQRITQLYLGHSHEERRWNRSRTPLDRLIQAAERFDIRLFPTRRKQ